MKNKFNETGTCCGTNYWILPKSPKEFSSSKTVHLNYELSKVNWQEPAFIKKLEAIASQSKKLQLDQIVSEYYELIEVIKRKFSDPRMIEVVLQEIRKDMRASELRQKSYHPSLHSLPQKPAKRENLLTEEQASRLIASIANFLKSSKSTLN
jgi:hypothetical protein